MIELLGRNNSSLLKRKGNCPFPRNDFPSNEQPPFKEFIRTGDLVFISGRLPRADGLLTSKKISSPVSFFPRKIRMRLLKTKSESVKRAVRS